MAEAKKGEVGHACIVSLPEQSTVTLRLATPHVQISMCPERSREISSVLDRLQTKLHKAYKKLRIPAPSLSLLTPSGTAVDLSSAIEALEDCTLLLGATPLPLRRNPPEVLSLSVPGHPMEGRPIMPIATLQNATGANWRWLRAAKQPEEQWQVVAESQCYTPTQADYGGILMVEAIPVSDNAAPGAKMCAFTGTQCSTDCPQPPLIPCTSNAKNAVSKAPEHGYHLNRQELLQPEPPTSLRVVSYNLLADYNLRQEIKRGGDKFYGSFEDRDIEMAFEHRRQLLFQELVGYDADVIMLQEVDQKAMFSDFLQPHFSRLDYGGHYSNKQHTASPLGQAIFWRRSKYLLLSTHTADLTTPIPQPTSQQERQLCDLVQSNATLQFALSKTTTVCNIVLLQPQPGVLGPPLIVCNNHLFGDPVAPHLRVLQSATALHHCSAAAAAARVAGAALLIGGDFNCSTEEGACQFLANGELEAEHNAWDATGSFEWGALGGKSPQTQTPSLDGEGRQSDRVAMALRHEWHLANAVEKEQPHTWIGSVGEFGRESLACVDHLFYDTSCLHMSSLLPSASVETIEKWGAPSSAFPSDHLAVVVDFTFV